MKSFDRIFAAAIVFIALLFCGANSFLLSSGSGTAGRPYRVEVNRAAREIEKNIRQEEESTGEPEQDVFWEIDLLEYVYVTNIARYSGGDAAFFEDTDSDYLIRQINGELYRFDYTYTPQDGYRKLIVTVNVILISLSGLVLVVLIFVRQTILKPFAVFCDVPYELSKGNLTIPLKENKSRFFGRFVWGVDLLRENMEQQKQRELDLQRDKKTLVLSISHDIKTPLSAMKLYAKALSKGLYTDAGKQREIAECINAKADEIEEFVSQIVKASREDFLNLEVKQGEFYLSELVGKVVAYYREKLGMIQTDFSVGGYTDCILKGDFDRSVEVLQNIMENAIKYGDGERIFIEFSEEEDCLLITVGNSGCTLPEMELPHVFESFWRGSNTGSHKGSGLGLYICRQLMHRMKGEIFAELQGDTMCVTVAFGKAL